MFHIDSVTYNLADGATTIEMTTFGVNPEDPFYDPGGLTESVMVRRDPYAAEPDFGWDRDTAKDFIKKYETYRKPMTLSVAVQLLQRLAHVRSEDGDK